MKKLKIIFFSLLLVSIFVSYSTAAETADNNDWYFHYQGSNQNFTIDSQSVLNKKYYTYNYNRFRNDLDFGWENTLKIKIVGDLEHYWGESFLRSPEYGALRGATFNMPVEPYHYIVSSNAAVLRSYLYRAYAVVYLQKSSLTAGYQRIPLGVGRIWNPTDIINPPNPVSIETGERLGVYGAHYTYNLAELYQLNSFLTLDVHNRTRDYGFRIVGNMFSCDVGLSAVRNEAVRMSGLELDGEFLETGVGLRSEIGFFEDELVDENYYSALLGIDYAFENSLYLLGEYLVFEDGATNKYDYYHLGLQTRRWAQLARRYLGMMAAYEVSPLMTVSATTVANLEDGSYFIGPGLQYSLDDNADLSLGASFFCGSQYSEFWYYKEIYYVRCGVYF